MTLFLSFFFILCTNMIIFNLPSSQGNSSGYHQLSLSQVLTPSERLKYTIFGTLPNRIYYSYSKRAYVVRGQPGGYKNDLRRKIGKNRNGYKVMPRWKYYLSKLSPVGLIKSGMEYVSLAKSLLGFGRGFKDFDDAMDDMDGSENPDDDPNNNEDDGSEDGENDDAKDGSNDDAKDDAKDGAKDGSKDGAKDGANGDAKDGANNNANGDNNNNKDSSGMFPSLPSLPTFPTDYFSSLYGGSGDGNKDNNNDKKEDNNEKKEDNNDQKEDDNFYDAVDYTELAQEALQSDTTKDLVKTGISLFVPGGAAIIAAMDASSKFGGAANAVEKVPKIKKL